VRRASLVVQLRVPVGLILVIQARFSIHVSSARRV